MAEPSLSDRPGPRDPLVVGRKLLHNWRRLIVLPVACAAVAGLIAFLVPVRYAATASFITDTGARDRGVGGLAGVAAALNLGLGGSGEQGPQFFAEVLTSRTILDAVLAATVSVAGSPIAVATLYGPQSPDRVERERTRRRLRESIGVSTNARTGIVTVVVEARTPEAAVATETRLLEELDRFNRETRQTQARARREFASERLREARDSLRGAEEALRVFAERNRLISNSPALRLDLGRRERVVGRWEGLTADLLSQYELARIEEVNSTPVITVLDAPDAPSRPSRPKRLRFLIAGFVVGLVAAGLWALWAPSAGG